MKNYYINFTSVRSGQLHLLFLAVRKEAKETRGELNLLCVSVVIMGFSRELRINSSQNCLIPQTTLELKDTPFRATSTHEDSGPHPTPVSCLLFSSQIYYLKVYAFGRGLCIGKTNEACQLLTESSQQHVLAFPMKKLAETACRSAGTVGSWYRVQLCSFRRTSFFGYLSCRYKKVPRSKPKDLSERKISTWGLAT